MKYINNPFSRNIVIVFIIVLIIILKLCSDSNKYADHYVYIKGEKHPVEMFQILLRAIWDFRIEVIDLDLKSDSSWSFNKGDFITFNDKIKLFHDPDNCFDETFTSKKLTPSELRFFLNEYIFKVSFNNKNIERIYYLTPDESKKFRKVLNRNFHKDQKQFKKITKGKNVEALKKALKIN